MVGSFSFSVRLPFSYGFVLRLLGAYVFRLSFLFLCVPMVFFFVRVPSVFNDWLFRFRLRFLCSGSSFASFRLNGGLKGFFVRSPLGVVFRFSSFLFALRFLRQVVCSSFSVLSDGSCFSSVFLSPSFRFSSSLFPSFFPMVSVFSSIPFKALFFFVFVPSFLSFRSRLRLFPFSLIRLALPFVSFVVFGFLSTSLHRDAPSGGDVGRAAWPRRIRRIGRT